MSVNEVSRAPVPNAGAPARTVMAGDIPNNTSSTQAHGTTS
jgi:hypothetical protein